MTMNMRSSDIYDAINLFKYSPTGQGKHKVAGQPCYDSGKHSQWAKKAVDILWWKYGDKEIGFKNMPESTYGQSARSGSRWGHDIMVSDKFSNTLDLVGISFILAHEGVHLAVKNTVERIHEEVICHTIECMYYKDMLSKKGVRIKRKHNNVVRTFTLKDMKPSRVKMELEQKHNIYFRKNRLLDSVFESKNYREMNISGRWAIKALDWWGGLNNRLPLSRAVLASKIVQDKSLGTNRLQPLIRILSSLRGALQWQDMATIGNKDGALEKLFENNRRHPTYKKWLKLKQPLKNPYFKW